MKIRIPLTLIFCISCSFLLAQSKKTLNEEFMLDNEEDFAPTKKKAPTKPAETTKAVAPLRLHKSPQTKQERLEQDILDTIAELNPIATGLSGFAKSPEAKKELDAKKKEYDEKVKAAEQRRKTQLGSKGGPWRTTGGGGGGYAPSYGGAGRSAGSWGGGGGDYGSYGGGWGGAGGGAGSWGAGDTTTPGSSLPKTEDTTKGTGGLGAGKGTGTTDDKDKTKSGTIITKETEKEAEKRKNNDALYAKATETLENASNKIAATLGKIKDKDPTRAARWLLTNTSFSRITPLLTAAHSAEPQLSKEEIEKVDKEKKNRFDAAEKRLSGLLNNLFAPALQAATYDDSAFQQNEQAIALQLLKSPAMNDHIKKDAIDARGQWWLDKWNRSATGGVGYTNANTTFQGHLRHAAPPPPLPAGTKQGVITLFNNVRNTLTTVIQKFPDTPACLDRKIEEIDRKIQEVENSRLPD